MQKQPRKDGEENIPDRGTASTKAWGPLSWTQIQAQVGRTEALVTVVGSSVGYLLVSVVQLESQGKTTSLCVHEYERVRVYVNMGEHEYTRGG